MRYRIEINLARREAAESVWHYLMEDEHTPCEFDDEREARRIVEDENRGDGNARLVKFTASGIGFIAR